MKGRGEGLQGKIDFDMGGGGGAKGIIGDWALLT